MAGYTRQESFTTGDIIQSDDTNNEFDQILAAFSSSSGHKHDGTAAEGPVLPLIGDAGSSTPLNKVLIDSSNDFIEFFVDVSGTSTQQAFISDGAILPTTTNDINLGGASNAFKSLFLTTSIVSAGGIILDAGTAATGISYTDSGTELLRFHNSGSNVIVESKVSDKDIIFKGNDGGSVVTALTIDMSDAGRVIAGGNMTVTGDLTVSGDDFFMATNTAGHLLVGDGTNYTPVAVSGDATLAASGAVAIAADAVTYAKMQNLATANRVLGSTSTGLIGETQIVAAMMAANSVDSDQYVDGSIDNAHLADDAVGADELAANAVVNASVASGAAIAVNKTALVAGTNITLATNTLNVDDAFLINSGDDTTSGVITSAGYTANVAAGSGDVALNLQSGGTTKFVIGIDDSDSDIFKIHSSTALADTSDFEMTAAGVASFASTLNVGADLVVTGDLTVNGDTVTVNTATLSVEDPLIILASGNGGADSVDIGLYGLYDTSGSQDLFSGLFRDANDSGKWKLFKDLQVAPTTTVNTSGTGYAIGTLIANIEGGSVTGITDIVVADGGTGVSTLTDGGILLGSGTGAITAMAVLTDGQMIVGDGTTDPVAESGATLRTSIGVGTGDSPQVTGIELGHATDSTITRISAGILAIEGSNIIMASNTSSATAAGIVELATDAESIAGTDAARAVTPASLHAKTASATVIGLVELATDAEAVTGSDTARALTPANLAAVREENVVLSEAKSVNISTPLLGTTDHTFTGLSAQMLAGGAIAAFKLVCIHTTTSEVVTADASAYATARVLGIAPAAIGDTATGTVLLQGFIRDDTFNFTTGSTLYLSETAGAMTHTAPTTDGAFVNVVGVALSPDVVYINPSMDVIEHA